MDNFNQKMKESLMGLKKREKLLLHTCCAVCAGGALAREFSMETASQKSRGIISKNRLTDFFDITLFFYNPNIDPQEEYLKRAGELAKLESAFPIRHIVIAEYKPDEFQAEAQGYEGEREGGGRCGACIRLRLLKTAQYAKRNGFDRFSTVLTAGSRKSVSLNHDGERAGKQLGVPFLPADFKKENGFAIANKTAERLGLYRQNYCGCIYSKK